MIYTEYIRVSNPLYSDGFSATDEDCPVYIIRGHWSKFPNYHSFLTVKIFFTLTNSLDLDEMPHFVASSWSSIFTKVQVYGFPVLYRHEKVQD